MLFRFLQNFTITQNDLLSMEFTFTFDKNLPAPCQMFQQMETLKL